MAAQSAPAPCFSARPGLGPLCSRTRASHAFRLVALRQAITLAEFIRKEMGRRLVQMPLLLQPAFSQRRRA
eukprot:15438499-Alexandrium_andersonii.AAC.1